MKKIYRLFRYDWPLHFVLLLTNWLPDNVPFIRLRGLLASPFFKACGTKLGLGRHVTFYDPSKIEIGNNVYIAYGCWFSAGAGVQIEDEVILGPYVVVATTNHTRVNGSFRWGEPKGQIIILEKGSWIGSHVVLAAGARIGKGSVVGANTFVNSIVPNDVVFAGNQGKIVKPLE